VNHLAAARAIRRLRAPPARLMRNNPRLAPRLSQFAPREVRRLFVDDYEMRYEIQGETILITNVWHTRENR
jgi:plasmid stabilization system protein ParE